MMQKHCLNQKELARRWGLSHRTLERWRYTGEGPAFLKLGGRVLYRCVEIEAFEESQLQRAKAVSTAVTRAGLREANTFAAASRLSTTSSRLTTPIPAGTMSQRPE